MNKQLILQKLTKEGIVYGEQYTIQASYLFMKGGKKVCPMEVIGYTVDINEYIEVNGKMELTPFPFERFEIDELSKAVCRFAELEGEKE